MTYEEVEDMRARLLVVRAAVEFDRKDAALYALNLLELQLITIRPRISPPCRPDISRVDR